MWGTIRRLLAQGCSIVLTTHYLEEAEALADRVAVLAKGKLIALGTVDEVRSIVSRKTDHMLERAAGRRGALVARRRRRARATRDRLQITAVDAEAVVRRLLATDQHLRNLEVTPSGSRRSIHRAHQGGCLT